jgi:hypothetical protein
MTFTTDAQQPLSFGRCEVEAHPAAAEGSPPMAPSANRPGGRRSPPYSRFKGGPPLIRSSCVLMKGSTVNMGSEGQTHRIVCLLVLVGLLSCRPSSTSESPQTPNGQTAKGGTDAGRAGLSKDEMIQVAKRELHNRGHDPNNLRIYYDEGNRYWHRCFPKPLPELEGRDYQVMDCWDRISEPVWILIDRKTGAVLKTVIGYGPSLETRDGDTLSKDEVIQVAELVLRYRDMDPNDLTMYYDEDNQRWHRCFPKPVAELEGHDYQVVEYLDDKPGNMSDPLWIVIDKKTGAILKTSLLFGQKPTMVSP